LAAVEVPEPVPLPSPLALAPEPAAPTLAPAEPAPLGGGLGRFLVGFAGWMLLVACALWGIDYATARWQRRAIQHRQAERNKAQELALQQLRADLDDLVYRPDGGYEVGIYLQNFQVDKPFHVLGPSVRVFVQSDRRWHEMPARAVGYSEKGVAEITRKKVFRISFRADRTRYDELLKGYMHVRITNVMVVSASAEPAEDLFGRTDDYYVYLKPQTVADAEVRKRNGWTAKALVPRWIGMPPH
jgi:putative ABC transport system ATP-binding protein/macrolide transport system ATP-binding/permease protein/lipoprotein-releasing system ATP-binding protein